MVKNHINLPHSFCRLALAMIVAAAALTFSLGNLQAQAQKALVDINTATQQELEAVKGVGAATAKKIIAGRPYKSLDELTKAGLSAKKIEALKPYVAAGKAPAAPALTPAVEKKPKAAPAAAKPQAPPPAGKEVAPGKTVPAAPPAAAAPVDLNTADQKALESLPGIGPALAKKIMEGRPYQSADDLSRIKGMNKSKIDAIKDKVTVTAPKPTKPTLAPAAAKPQASPTAGKEVAPGKTVPAASPAAAAPVDLNTADQKALESLPGIGPALAKKIMEGRPYQSADDLSRIKGMNKSKIDAIKDKVTVTAPKPMKPAPAPAAAKPEPAPVPPAAKPEPTPAPAAATPQPAPAVKKEAAPSKEAPAATKLAPGEKVNINTASKEDLDKLWGIGDVKSQAIIEGRPYEKIEDIMKVKGIKEGEFGKIKDLITVK
jgi:competence protein ComEA